MKSRKSSQRQMAEKGELIVQLGITEKRGHSAHAADTPGSAS